MKNNLKIYLRGTFVMIIITILFYVAGCICGKNLDPSLWQPEQVRYFLSGFWLVANVVNIVVTIADAADNK